MNVFDEFKDYFYYLLPAPFKRVVKSVNQWYILFSVIGNEFDKMIEELYRACDETMITTCSDDLLIYHAKDRGLYRYAGESNDNFRTRIALYDELIASGGMREALLRAAQSAGYDKVEHKWLGELGKWASFELVLYVPEGEEPPIKHDVLRTEVQKWKDSTSCDNYRYVYSCHSEIWVGGEITVVNRIEVGD